VPGVEYKMLIMNSQIAIPLDDQVQEYVAGGRCDQGYGSAVDVVYLVVCAVYIWASVGIQLPAWQ
jgi:hypothetical protein